MIEVKFESNNDEVEQALKAALERGLEACGLQAEGYAKMLCPVDTGNLRNSITHTTDVTEEEVYIGTNVEYAPYVEMGTIKTKAQPFLQPAAENHADEYKEIFESYLSDL